MIKTLNKPRHLAKLYQPSFSTLMQLYSKNFVYLNRLFKDTNLMQTLALTSKDANISIRINHIERSKYTTTFCMNYVFSDDDQIEKIPQAKIRMYFDSRQAEVISLQNSGQLKSFARLIKFEQIGNLDARWQLNLFLYRWLKFCLAANYKIIEK